MTKRSINRNRSEINPEVERQKTNNLPAQVSRHLVSSITTVVAHCKTVERAFKNFKALERKMPGEVWHKGVRLYNEPAFFDLAAGRQTLAETRQALELLPLVTKPSPPNDIATQLTWLAGSFPNAKKSEQHIFMQTLCDDIADLNPSFYALQQACERVRHTKRFYALPENVEVWTAVKKAIDQERYSFKRWWPTQADRLQQQMDRHEREVLPHIKKHQHEKPFDVASLLTSHGGDND
jgi:hypothetical protein